MTDFGKVIDQESAEELLCNNTLLDSIDAGSYVVHKLEVRKTDGKKMVCALVMPVCGEAVLISNL